MFNAVLEQAESNISLAAHGHDGCGVVSVLGVRICQCDGFSFAGDAPELRLLGIEASWQKFAVPRIE